MRKTIEVANAEELAELTSTVLSSISQTTDQISDIEESLELFSMMKFGGVGCDPLNLSRDLNVIEQINQAFTYLASFRATGILLAKHPEETPFRLNLGTAPGSDIESVSGVIAAEVFASVTPSNNQKLKKDIDKVAATDADHKYSFFMCPNFEPGRRSDFDRNGVQVWALEL
jgi:hypothetical protein